jgi:hypothetical protein
MFIDDNTTKVLLALFAVANTALLVYQAVRLERVHTAVNGAATAALAAAHDAGVAAGILATQATQATASTDH